MASPISYTKFRRYFSRYIQHVREGETFVITYKKYSNRRFIIRPHHPKKDASIFAIVTCI